MAQWQTRSTLQPNHVQDKMQLFNNFLSCWNANQLLDLTFVKHCFTNIQAYTIRAKSCVDALMACTLFQQCGSTGCLAQKNADLTTPLLYLLTVKLVKERLALPSLAEKLNSQFTIVLHTQMKFSSQNDITKLAVMTYATLWGLISCNKLNYKKMFFVHSIE